MKIFQRLNSPSVLAGAVILALVVNSCIHYSSPVYRYYEQNVKHVNDQYGELRKRLFNDLVPFVQLALTNRVLSVAPSVSPALPPVSPSGSVSTNAVPLDLYLDFKTFQHAGNSFLFWDGNSFALGDLFLGSPIVYISPTLIQTVERRFIHSSLRGTSNATRNHR